MTRLAPLPVPQSDLSIYRGHCIALLRKYFVMSVEIGRLPAILGREFFRTSSRDYHVHSFENLVVFVIDVERCLDRLRSFDKDLVAFIVLQEYTEEEAAKLLHCTDRTIRRRLPDALDFLTELFLRHGMLNVNERVPDDPLLETLCGSRCAKRLPQRAPKSFSRAPSGHSPNTVSQPATPLVKPPFSTISVQAAATKENIFFSDVSGLPPRICYTENIS